MNIGYSVLSVDDSRIQTKAEIHNQLHDLPFVEVDCVDGRKPGSIEEWLTYNPNILVTGNNFHRGELGVWFSQINAWRALRDSSLDALIVLEDDAVIRPAFRENFQNFVMNLPADFDFAALAVPEDQYMDYAYDRAFDKEGGWYLLSHTKKYHESSQHYLKNDYVATAYQGYSCVATMFSKAGAERLLSLIEETGLSTAVDCYIFAEHFKNNLAGYAPMPTIPRMISFVEQGTIARATGFYS